MKLLSIKLCNFRQFYGQTPEVKFASGNQNITIIHGNNGSGKTTLLNAFTWVLYERFTAAFAAPQQLVNKRALSEAQEGKAVKCFVELQFEHDYQRYRVERLYRAYNRGTTVECGQTECSMWISGDDGRWRLTDYPIDEVIGRILPRSLHQYFFFDGERIESWGREEKKGEIAEATKELLGIEVFDRALRHLKESQKSLEGELERIGDPQTKQFLREKEDWEKQRQTISDRQAEITQELNSHAHIKEELNNELRNLSGAEELQKRRADLEKQQQELRERLKQFKSELKHTISSQAYTVFLPSAIEQFRALMEQLRHRGELPRGIKQQFVQDLLAQHQCICGTHLAEGSHAYTLVAQWMNKAGVGDVEENALKLLGEVSDLENKAELFWKTLNSLRDEMNQKRQDLSAIETQLDTVKSKLRSYPDLDIQSLQKRLDQTESRMSELERETGANEQKIKLLDADIAQKEKQIAKHQSNEKKQQLAQKRIQVAVEAINCIAEMKYRLDTEFRLELEGRVQDVFQQISFTPYSPQLSEKYELSLIDKTTLFEHPVAASTGENQILSLSFIGAIMDRVRQWSQEHMHLGPDSSTFPMVMDSPFGSLDEVYRRQVAKALPQLASQLVVLVTKTQWRGEVEEEMGDRIQQEYVLVYHSPKPDCEADALSRLGQHYPLVKPSDNEFEYTEIVALGAGNDG
ncbi:MAG: AAA family ATPase [Roseofilum sp. SBFL]|uniref:AAA family ATPase n=1 Tax=unclassified Roseofilum TaxID=2620099 RepID=UPI001AFF69DE|nr:MULTISPECIES: AAA family ATPase [unclassified Roseofilum]MBP0011641.1 AAA family ATPase [Roseofilum sp. SID3]MBP0025854.1 AAA family ATPase [Roseofilum sp. SID2]MBP0040054.1 AAA family ATPase [Roseofilum sp. SID1]MBP0043993.1 AAA family ATPase [Roseofilum sp. SBFL]